jgi:hypothetical protein
LTNEGAEDESIGTIPRSLVLGSLFIGKVRNMFWSFLDAASHQSSIDGQLIKTVMHSLKKNPGWVANAPFRGSGPASGKTLTDFQPRRTDLSGDAFYWRKGTAFDSSVGCPQTT